MKLGPMVRSIHAKQRAVCVLNQCCELGGRPSAGALLAGGHQNATGQANSTFARGQRRRAPLTTGF